ncbi:MAG TPA: M10 family metallopeptidase C-terminal domain-containing protein, partial [Hyphomicrobium sp.]|nr:M10 family metallopeptidase C-terminal domain-containing protein [Hyphomicrobium sp.]
MAKATWTNAQIISQLDSGYHWSGSQITYSYATNASWFPGAESAGFSAFNASQKAAANAAIGLFDDAIAADFKLVTDTSSANLKLANTTTNIGYAHAYYPDSSAEAGSVWLNSDYDASTGTNDLVTPKAGQWGYQTYIHEIGHAMGLDHPGDYNGGSPTYANDAEYMQDSVQYTVMSYFDASETGADHVASDGKLYYAQTLMMHDILVLQDMYGAETTTRAGNTVYGYNATAGKDVYNFALNKHPIVCIVDAGGTDTLDLSQSNYACKIDLNPGTFSNSDMMTSNLSIAHGTWIENATGGKVADVITGNVLNNVLNGLAGNDVLNGGDGNDTLNGGVGNDALRGNVGNDWLDGSTGGDRLTGGAGNDTYIVDSASDIIEELAAGGTDVVRTGLSTYTLGANVDNLTFTGTKAFVGRGNGSSNLITGGSGADKLYGFG